ncbi:MAG: hypothetical protein MUF54_13305, partial [Polyangiaceae bacterium]|nr:hypothetical protein [Polyangiaceae bacterium]
MSTQGDKRGTDTREQEAAEPEVTRNETPSFAGRLLGVDERFGETLASIAEHTNQSRLLAALRDQFAGTRRAAHERPADALPADLSRGATPSPPAAQPATKQGPLAPKAPVRPRVARPQHPPSTQAAQPQPPTPLDAEPRRSRWQFWKRSKTVEPFEDQDPRGDTLSAATADAWRDGPALRSVVEGLTRELAKLRSEHAQTASQAARERRALQAEIASTKAKSPPMAAPRWSATEDSQRKLQDATRLQHAAEQRAATFESRCGALAGRLSQIEASLERVGSEAVRALEQTGVEAKAAAALRGEGPRQQLLEQVTARALRELTRSLLERRARLLELERDVRGLRDELARRASELQQTETLSTGFRNELTEAQERLAKLEAKATRRDAAVRKSIMKLREGWSQREARARTDLEQALAQAAAREVALVARVAQLEAESQEQAARFKE